MKVVAIKRGYIHGQFKRIGAEFECTEEEFSETWMSQEKDDLPKKIDNSKITRAIDAEYEPLEIPSLMNKKKKEEKKPAKKKAAKKPNKKAD